MRICPATSTRSRTELMKSVARRISDRHMLRLIKMWLEAPVEENDKRGLDIERPGTKTRDAEAPGLPDLTDVE